MAQTNRPPLTDSVIVVGSDFCAANTVSLTVARRKKVLRYGNFHITDDNGNIVFKIKKKVICFHPRRVIVDHLGITLLSLKEKISSAHCRWNVFRGESDEPKDLLFTVKKSSIFQSKANLDVYLANNTKEDACDFKVKGQWYRRSCIFSMGDSNTNIAQLAKENTNMSSVEADAFIVTVNPNIDKAFIIALVAVIDAIYSRLNISFRGEDVIGGLQFGAQVAAGFAAA